MELESNRAELGTVKISNEVVAVIAGLAASELRAL